MDIQQRKERDKLRGQILCDLSTEGSLNDDNGSFAEFLTTKKHDSDGVESVSAWKHPVVSIAVGADDDAMSTVSTLTTKSISPIKTSKRTPKKPPRELWEPIGVAGGASGLASLGPFAFSEASLAESHHSNMIDGEGHSLLRKFAKHKTDAEAFDKIIPDVFLRNPKMTTAIKVPKLKKIDPSELLFGNQQVCYTIFLLQNIVYLSVSFLNAFYRNYIRMLARCIPAATAQCRRKLGLVIL